MTEAVIKVKTKAEIKVKIEAETRVRIKVETGAKTEAETRAKTEAERKVEAGTRIDVPREMKDPEIATETTGTPRTRNASDHGQDRDPKMAV